MAPEQSIRQKSQWLTRMLAPWSNQLGDLASAERTLQRQYRRKVCLHAQWDGAAWRLGLRYKDTVVDLKQCPNHAPIVEKAVAMICMALPPHEDFPMVYYVQSNAQITLVVKQRTTPDLSWLNQDLIFRLSSVGVEGLWLHLNPVAGKNVFAKNTWHLLWGSPRSKSDDGLIYGPRSFQQQIPSLYHQSLMEAEHFISPKPHDVMVDLYCGIGASLVRWTRRTHRVIGIEWDGESVECAKINAPMAVVFRGRCQERIPQLMEYTKLHGTDAHDRLLYVNPPRTGLEPEVLDWVIHAYRPARMAYLSCSPGTLKRDLMQLEKFDHKVVRITPYDFFPQTHHVECLSLLQRTSSFI